MKPESKISGSTPSASYTRNAFAGCPRPTPGTSKAGRFSINVISAPRRPKAAAAVRPPTPPPTIKTRRISFMRKTCDLETEKGPAFPAGPLVHPYLLVAIHSRLEHVVKLLLGWVRRGDARADRGEFAHQLGFLIGRQLHHRAAVCLPLLAAAVDVVDRELVNLLTRLLAGLFDHLLQVLRKIVEPDFADDRFG